MLPKLLRHSYAWDEIPHDASKKPSYNLDNVSHPTYVLTSVPPCGMMSDVVVSAAGGVLAIRGPQRARQNVAGVCPGGVCAHSSCRERQISGTCETVWGSCPLVTILPPVQHQYTPTTTPVHPQYTASTPPIHRQYTSTPPVHQYTTDTPPVHQYTSRPPVHQYTTKYTSTPVHPQYDSTPPVHHQYTTITLAHQYVTSKPPVHQYTST